MVASGCIELYEVARYVLELALGALLHLLPGTGAYAVDFGRNALLATVFGEFVERVYGYEQNVVVLVHELYDFLHAAVDIGAQQPGEFAHSVVDVHNVVARFYLSQFLER